MQLLCGRGQLLGERGDFIGFALHRRDRRADFLEHAVEALLEEAELVGFGRRRAHREVPLLRFAHDAARMANPSNQRRGDAFQRHRDDDEHAGLEIGAGVEPRSARIQLAVRPGRDQIRDRRDEYEEVTDRLALIERVRQHGDKECRDHAAVAEPDDEHVDERDDRVEHRGAAGDEHDRAEARVGDAAQFAEHTENEQRGGDGPAAPVAAVECFEVLEALLERGGVVVPATRAGGERQAADGLGHCGGPNPKSDAVRNASTTYPSRSSASRPPSSRSSTTITPSTLPPSLVTALIASRAELPVVSTSSTMTTAYPDAKQPSMRRPVPWSLGCLRTVNASSDWPRRRAVSARA